MTSCPKNNHVINLFWSLALVLFKVIFNSLTSDLTHCKSESAEGLDAHIRVQRTERLKPQTDLECPGFGPCCLRNPGSNKYTKPVHITETPCLCWRDLRDVDSPCCEEDAPRGTQRVTWAQVHRGMVPLEPLHPLWLRRGVISRGAWVSLSFQGSQARSRADAQMSRADARTWRADARTHEPHAAKPDTFSVEVQLVI